MWTRDDMLAAIKVAPRRSHTDGCFSAETHLKIAIDTAARMALDNAATVAERYGDPEIESAINDLKDDHHLGYKIGYTP